jgi:hypothetical protein
MLRRVTLVRSDVSVELSASITRVTKIGELETTLSQLATEARREEMFQFLRNIDTYKSQTA